MMLKTILKSSLPKASGRCPSGLRLFKKDQLKKREINSFSGANRCHQELT